ncbi:MAG: A/G-specific adenine glycosylase [Candidatus Margulisiibacteriota bacterium]|nr:A/G-specific adenine glycosylase [Candidatus Margulisiibacteriota bacterium]
MWAKQLIEWFNTHQRPLPWRKSPSSYYTLISEFMAQQTQIATVIPYFNRWIKQFPTIQDVAQADEDTIFKAWEGLGYYSRAKNLHKTAKIISEELNGIIPESASELETLPGIGPYIAAAIASIAFSEKIAVVDGNVLRVMTRFFGIKDDISDQKTKVKIQNRLNQVIKPLEPASFNQGLMELGALICLPKNPNCMDCPISETCYAKNMNETTTLPVKKKKPPTPHYTIVIGIIKNKTNNILITKRKKDQLLGGLWEFPGGKVNENETLENALIREIKEEVNLDIKSPQFLCKVNHAYSHFKITMHAYCCTLDSDNKIKLSSADEFRWINQNEFDDFAFPKANKVVIQNLIGTS